MRWFEIIAEEERKDSLLIQINKIHLIDLVKSTTLSQNEQMVSLFDDTITNMKLLKQLSYLLQQLLDIDHVKKIKRNLTPNIDLIIKQLIKINDSLLTESMVYKKEYDAIQEKLKSFIKILDEFITSIKGYPILKENLNDFIVILERTVKYIDNYRDKTTPR